MRQAVILLLATLITHAAEPSAILGKIGDIEVGTDHVRESLTALDDASLAALHADREALTRYVRALLIQRLVIKQALEEKWDQEPAVIAKLVRARESTLAESYLEAASLPDADYPSESEIQAAYDANKDQMAVPRSYQLAQIYIEAGKNSAKAAETAARKKLDAVLAKLASKQADFAAIARQSSEDAATAVKGGEIGWLTESQIQPEIREKLPTLKLNAVSEPLRLDDGWHILKVLDIREARTPALGEVRDKLVTNLRAEKCRINRQTFVTDLLKKHPLAINEIEIMKLR